MDYLPLLSLWLDLTGTLQAEEKQTISETHFSSNMNV